MNHIRKILASALALALLLGVMPVSILAEEIPAPVIEAPAEAPVEEAAEPVEMPAEALPEEETENSAEPTEAPVPESADVFTEEEPKGDFDIDENHVLQSYNGSDAHVAVPDGVIRIGYGAFRGNDAVESVTLPDSCKVLESHAFSGCANLRTVSLPEGFYEMGECCFLECASLESISLPDGVQEIPYEAFMGCTSLKRVELPDFMEKIDNEAFWGCSSLESIIVPEGVEAIIVNAFASCTSLRSVQLPSTLKRIEESAFRKCTSLPTIELPDGVTTIESCAFQQCTGMTSITLSDAITEIGEEAFDGCANLTISVYEGSYAHEYCSANAQVQGFAYRLISTDVELSRPVMGQAKVVSSTELQMTWEVVENADGYELWRSDKPDEDYVKIADTAQQKYSDTHCLFGKINYYKVRAYADVNGRRSYSEFSVYRSCFGLATPGIRSLQIQDGGVKVTAATVMNATGYYIYRCETINGLYDRLGSTTLSGGENFYRDTTAEEGHTYYYKARAYYVSPTKVTYVGPFSVAKSISYSTMTLERPTMSLSYVISSTELKLTWEAVDEADGYELWRSGAADGDYTKVGETAGLQFNDTHCLFGKINYYKVRAYANVGSGRIYSPFSVYRSCFGLSTPGVQKMERVDGGVKVTAATVMNATGYYIYRCETQNGLYERLGTTTLADGINSYMDTTAAPGYTYYYKARAYHVSSAGVTYVGPFSVGKRISINGPEGVSVRQTAAAGVTLTWQAISGAAGYEVHQSASANGTFRKVADVQGTEAIVNSLTQGSTYYFKLRGYKTVNGSKQLFPLYSDVVSIRIEDATLLLLDYETNAAGNGIVITGYRGTDANVTIPATINGLPVVKIGERAFEGNTLLQSIDLPDSVQVIGQRAFAGCTKLHQMN